MDSTVKRHGPRIVGFTLIELMIVVTIIAVLAAIGSYAYGRLTKRSRINQAVTFFASVAGAQTAYFDLYGEFGATDPAAPFDDYDPAAADIRGRATTWSAPKAEWAQIGVRLPTSTHFQYVVVAGDPTTPACTAPPDVAVEGGGTRAVPACASVTVGTYWYYVVGRADQDADGFMSVFGSSDAMRETHWSINDLELE